MATQCESKTKKALESWIERTGLTPLDPDAPEDYVTNYESDKDLHRSYRSDDGLEVRLDLTGFTSTSSILLKWEIVDGEHRRSVKGVAFMRDNTSQTTFDRHLDNIFKLVTKKYDGDLNALTDEDKDEARRNAIVPDDDPVRLKDEETITDLIRKLDGSLQLFRETLECLANNKGCVNYCDISLGHYQETDIEHGSQLVDQSEESNLALNLNR